MGIHGAFCVRLLTPAAIAWLWACGCSDGLIDASPPGTPMARAAFPSQSDPFLNAVSQPLEDNPASELSGQLSPDQPLQIWALGRVPAGTRLIVDVQGRGRNLSLGLFDEQAQVLIINHDRAGRFNPDPYVAYDVSADLPALYLAVAADAQESQPGLYEASITQRWGLASAQQRPQHAVLNFLGADHIAVGGAAPVDIKPFDAADLEPSWKGLTADMIGIVTRSIERTYAGLNVHFHLAEDLPAGEELTWIHFGGLHPSNVGLASNVDYGNRQLRQTAVVYVQNFAKYIKHGYDHREIAQGLANVAAHELGHLLGCNHTADPADVMNVSPTVDALVAPKYFVSTARLDPKVFLTGGQDGAAVIHAAVGGDWSVVEAFREDSAEGYLALAPAVRSVEFLAAPVELNQHSASQVCGRHPPLPRRPAIQR